MSIEVRPNGGVQATRGGARSAEQTLRDLFLTLFLRGRSARGLQKESAPASVSTKLRLTLLLYCLFGLMALVFWRQPVFTLSAYLHGMTFVFVGMFVAASSGEILFNKDEAEILLHRPVTPAVLLRAKVTVLLKISLWMACAFNAVGLFVGLFSPNASWLFSLVHALSVCLESLFCVSFVVVTYQLCLRWFGRERFDNLITTIQVIASIGAVMGGQLLPRALSRVGHVADLNAQSWWIALLPPAWFAGLDDTFAGDATHFSLILMLIGLATTAAVVLLAYTKLTHDYELGLQNLSSVVVTRQKTSRTRRWTEILVNAPPLSWWIRDPAERAAFMLSVVYMLRDRDVKLRLYPGIAPMFIMPMFLMIQDRGGGFMVGFSSAFLGIVPMTGISLLRFSQQWQAADLFRIAPLLGPAALCHGLRRACILVLGLPAVIVYAISAWFLSSDRANMTLMIVGLMALPVLSLIPCRDGDAIPLSRPTEEAKSASRGLVMFGATMACMALSGIAYWAKSAGHLNEFLFGEAAIMGMLYFTMRQSIAGSVWSHDE